MNSERPAEAIAGSVDQTWLDEITPWLHEENPPALTVLPEHIAANGKAVYSTDTASLAKQIRSQGFDAQLLSTPVQTFRSEYSADSLIFLSFLLNVSSSAAWDSFKFLMHIIRLRVQGIREGGAEPQLTLSQGIFKYPDGSSYLWQKYSGPPDHVIDLAESTVLNYISGSLGSEPSAVEPTENTGKPPKAASE